jgi:hypothetical protein
MSHDYTDILHTVLSGYALPHDGYHGVYHWARVWENGLRVAEHNGADEEVVRLFAARGLIPWAQARATADEKAHEVLGLWGQV